MAEKEEPDEFGIAADATEKKLVFLLDGLNTEEKKGTRAVFQWHAINSLKADHKRLGRWSRWQLDVICEACVFFDIA